MNINKIKNNLELEKQILERKLEALEIYKAFKTIDSKRQVKGFNQPVKVSLRNREVFDTIIGNIKDDNYVKGYNVSYRSTGETINSTCYYMMINKNTVIEVRLDETEENKKYELVITPYKQRSFLRLEEDKEWLKINCDMDNPELFFSISDGINNPVFTFIVPYHYTTINVANLSAVGDIVNLKELLKVIKKDYSLTKSNTKIRKRILKANIQEDDD